MSMINERVNDLVEEAVEVLGQKDRARAQYSALKRIVQDVTGHEPQAFKAAVDLGYYQGGYPKEDSPPLWESSAERFASSLAVLASARCKLSEEVIRRISEVFTKHGFNLEVSLPPAGASQPSIPVSEKTLEYVGRVTERFGRDQDVERLLELAGSIDRSTFISSALSVGRELQKQICQLSDEVKITKAEEAAQDQVVTKREFVIASTTRYRIRRIEDEEKRAEAEEKILDRKQRELEIINDALEN